MTADEVIEYLKSNLNRFHEVLSYMEKWKSEMNVVVDGLEAKKNEHNEANEIQGAD